MHNQYRRRRAVLTFLVLFGIFLTSFIGYSNRPIEASNVKVESSNEPVALGELGKIDVKGRSPKTGYSRDEFGNGWSESLGCDTRNIILNRDLVDASIDENCNVVSGVLNDPYTGKTIDFVRGASTSSDVQIDHVVALSDAWQTGAQLLSKESRVLLANDPLELLAVDGPANQQKSDGDASTWLPSNIGFRCQYVARQIAVKIKYILWVTQSEKQAIQSVLSSCPDQRLPKS